MSSLKNNSYCNGLVSFAFLVLFSIKMGESWRALISLRKQEETLFYLVNANLALYAIETCFYMIKGRILTAENLKILNRLEMFTISGIVVGIWGLILIYSDDISDYILS